MTTVWGVEHEERPTVSERWRATPLRWKIVIILVGGIVAGETALGLVGGIVGGSPAGSGPSSSFDTSPGGTAAFAQLLSDRGYRVVRSTMPLDQATVAPGSTLFVIDPSTWSTADTRVAGSVLRAGGRVVVAGQPPGDGLLATLFGAADPPEWSSQSAAAGGSTPIVTPIGTSPLSAGVSTVELGFDATGSIQPTGSATPFLAGPGGAFAVAAGSHRSGGPDAVLLASSTPLLNASLDQADNAALALDLAGAPSTTVVFDEYDHGYGRRGSGLAGLPSWWKWALGTALLGLLVWVLSAARRFGPIEPPGRIRIPPRIAYADSVATLLAALPAGRRVEAIGPIVAEGRALLCRRAGVPASASDGALSDAAVAAGVPAEVSQPILDPHHTDLVTAGRALAWLESSTGGTT